MCNRFFESDDTLGVYFLFYHNLPESSSTVLVIVMRDYSGTIIINSEASSVNLNAKHQIMILNGF